MSMTTITIEIDENLKVQAEKLFADRGLDIASVFQLFVKQVVREQKIPCIALKEKNQNESLKEMQEVKKESQESYPAEYLGVAVEEMMESTGARRYSTGLRQV